MGGWHNDWMEKMKKLRSTFVRIIQMTREGRC